MLMLQITQDICANIIPRKPSLLMALKLTTDVMNPVRNKNGIMKRKSSVVPIKRAALIRSTIINNMNNIAEEVNKKEVIDNLLHIIF